MRTVLSPSEVPHLWANQLQNHATTPGRNFYFEGATIYSYGRHFPIAVHYNELVLFTLRKYSKTTAKHIRSVSSAISHKKVVYCKNPDDAARGVHMENVNYWFNEINGLFDKLKKATKPELYLNKINGEVRELKEYMAVFPKIKLTVNQKKTLKLIEENQASIKQAVKKVSEEEDKKKEAARRKNKKAWEIYIAAWRLDRHKDVDVVIAAQAQAYRDTDPDPVTLLRVLLDKQIINTSKGIDVPLDVAKRFYDNYLKMCEKGGCNGNCGDWTILGYSVTTANTKRLVIGCHNILRAEIDLIAKQLNWK